MTPVPAQNTVIDLFAARDRRKVRVYRSKVAGVLSANKRALTRLFASGSLFTRQGTRAGKNLLAAHQKLLKVNDLLGQIAELDDERAEDATALFAEAEALLLRSRELATRTDAYLATLPR